MNPIYRHKLTIGATTYDVHPVYKDDMALDYQHESGEQFFRANLSGKMDFVGADASLIIGAPFTTEYILTIECSIDGGITWTTFHVSKFYQTDCTIDVDDLKVTVKPNVKDRYQKVLDGLEKEYNLIDLLPIIEPIRMTKRGVIQIYGSGDDIITNIYSGISWEQDFDLSGDPADFHFVNISNRIEMTFGENPPSGLGGVFTGISDEDGFFRLDNNEGVYYIVRYYQGRDYYTDINRISDDETIWRSIGTEEYSITFLPEYTGMTRVTSTGSKSDIYARLLCDVTQVTIQGTTYNTYPIDGNDPAYGGNYHYVIGYASNNLIQSERTSTTPTQWGRKNQQEYFNTPDDLNYYIPVSRSQWVEHSFWYLEDDFDYDLELQSRKEYTLRDAYPLYSVIQVLLDKLETGVTFSNSATYSQFLYGSTNPLAMDYGVLPYITPKSNVIKGEYKDPAMKAPITLAMVFSMLKKAFGCYWFIDDSMKLHIEHISYFKNGGSYSGSHQVGIDLTAIHQPTNGKQWSFDTSNYQYEKEQMPARYQYAWMDDCTDLFDGKAIDIVSPFVQTDKVEDINIGNFSSDIDYMSIAPDNFSKDGFVLLMAKTDTQTGEKYIPFYYYQDTENHTQIVQNWYASLHYLILHFLRSDLPAWTFNYGDDTDYEAYGIQRNKKQQVQIPLGDSTPDLMQLVRTAMGDGQVERMSINLSSRMAKTTLKYDTYAEE